MGDIGKAVAYAMINILNEKDITVMTVANRIDRYPTTFYSVINGQGGKRPSITTIYDFCMGVGMTLEEFFARKEFENLYD